MSRRPSASAKTPRQISKPTCSPEVQVELLLPRRQPPPPLPPPPPQKISIGPKHNLALLETKYRIRSVHYNSSVTLKDKT